MCKHRNKNNIFIKREKIKCIEDFGWGELIKGDTYDIIDTTYNDIFGCFEILVKNNLQFLKWYKLTIDRFSIINN